MNKQLNIFVDGSELTAIEKHELKKEHEKKVRQMLGVEEEEKKKKKKQVIEVEVNRYVRTLKGIFRVKQIVGQIAILEDINNSKRISNALVNHIAWVANDPYDLLFEDDMIYVELDNGAIRENVVYKVLEMKKGRKKFLVEDKQDGEVICIASNQIKRIKEVKPIWIFQE